MVRTIFFIGTLPVFVSLCGMEGMLNPTEPTRHLYAYGTYIHQLTANMSPIQEKVTITSRESEDSDKVIERKGILIRYPGAKATIVICHGFMCDKFDVGFVRKLFPQGKFNFLSFDFRAHGENSKGQCCTFGKDEALDVIAATEFVKNHPDLKNLPVFGYGFSMGAVASIEAQAKKSDLFEAMILDCPFDSSENMVRKALDSIQFSVFGYKFDMPGKQILEKYVFHPYVQEFVKFILKTVGHMDSKNIQTYIYRFSPSESIKKVHIPCMFIHCKEDKRVPVEAIRTIYNGAQGPKRLWVTNGRRHYDSLFYNPEKYSKQISIFFDEIMNGKIQETKKETVMEDIDEERAGL